MNTRTFLIVVLVVVTTATVAKSKPQQSVSNLKSDNSVNACGGGCVLSSQCAGYDSGNKDCRCTWFSCASVGVLSSTHPKENVELHQSQHNPIDDLKMGNY